MEARYCYAFGQRMAAVCVCRAAVEEGVNELLLAKGKIPNVPRDKTFHNQYPFNHRLSLLCDAKDADAIYGLYCQLSGASHGQSDSKVHPLRFLRESVKTIELLFTKYK